MNVAIRFACSSLQAVSYKGFFYIAFCKSQECLFKNKAEKEKGCLLTVHSTFHNVGPLAGKLVIHVENS